MHKFLDLRNALEHLSKRISETQKVDRALRARFRGWAVASKISSLRSMCFGKSPAERPIHPSRSATQRCLGIRKFFPRNALNLFPTFVLFVSSVVNPLIFPALRQRGANGLDLHALENVQYSDEQI